MELTAKALANKWPNASINIEEIPWSFQKLLYFLLVESLVKNIVGSSIKSRQKEVKLLARDNNKTAKLKVINISCQSNQRVFSFKITDTDPLNYRIEKFSLKFLMDWKMFHYLYRLELQPSFVFAWHWKTLWLWTNKYCLQAEISLP